MCARALPTGAEVLFEPATPDGAQVLREAVEEHLVPAMRREAEQRLKAEAEAAVAQACGEAIWEKLSVVSGTTDLPRERYATPAFHGWSSASVALLGRRLFED